MRSDGSSSFDKKKGDGVMADKKSRGKKKSSEKDLAQQVQFQFPAAEVEEVCLAGDFNDWNTKSHPMQKDDNGHWEILIPLRPGQYQYRFFVDGAWQNDPSCDGCVANPFGSLNCLKTVK
jgi:1,4-alpha-glucan branching enzyme